MNPEQLARGGSEAGEQTALFCWAAQQRARYPELEWLYAIPNGGARGDKRSAMIRGGQLKAQGVKAGVSDICLPVKRGQWSGLYIELKRVSLRPVRQGSAGGVTSEQAAFGAFVQGQGYGFAVCYGWVEASRVIEQYMVVGTTIGAP